MWSTAAMSRRPSLRAFAVALAAAPLIVSGASALAQDVGEPPLNDNYLFPIGAVDETGDLPRQFHETRDTSSATTQQDLFVPHPDEFPDNISGGRERTICNGTRYGRTIWY